MVYCLNRIGTLGTVAQVARGHQDLNVYAILNMFLTLEF